MKLFSLYKMGSNEPEYTEVTKEKKKGKKRTPPTYKTKKRKTKWPPLNLGDGWPMRNLIATQAHQSQGRAPRT